MKTLEALPHYDPDNRILSFRQWCELNCLSESTGRRILAAGTGPTVLQLSERRIGISIKANRVWQAGRALVRGTQSQSATR
jgi:hypothetical protein